MAVDKNKLEEEVCVLRFYKIVLSWDYLRILKESDFGEGKQLPTTYAFALVEHRQQDKIRLRLYLGGEIKRFNTDAIETCPRLLNMLPIVTEVQKYFYVMKGPPGTGKTQTILGLLSAILHATPARVHSKGKLVGVKRGPELPIEEKYNHWEKASPWLSSINPRDMIMPINGDDGFFPTSGNELVEQKLAGVDSQSGDKQKQGGVAKDKDSIRASILDEAVIVGDPVQLPATVISPVATKFGYGMSLFKRLQMAGYPVQMLKTQYRMNPEIRSFPSREFYNEALEDGPDVEEQTKRSWHKFRCFGPFCFFDIHDGKESQPSGSGSWVNIDEVEFVLAMYSKLVSRYPELKVSSRLAIISPYRHQVKLFREKFRSTFGVESDKVVDINTVDGFQGREKDVAIFSCVRASKDKGIGFVADFRRMNVGITRARASVLVVGSASTLKRDDHWKNLVESAEQRNVLFKTLTKLKSQVSKPYNDFFSEANLKSMEVKESMAEKPEGPPEEMDVDVPIDANAGSAEQGQPEDNDWGDAGEGEAYEGDFGGED
ncbi:UNVERIFIED_CONTAM: putative helicase MAGATAMA 3 [Sesamum indicum]